VKVTHPRFGTVTVLQESPLFYQIDHPTRGYSFWFPKSDLAIGEPEKEQPRKKKTAEEKAEAAAEALAKKAVREARKLCPACGKPGLVVTGSRATGLKHEHPPCSYLQRWAPSAVFVPEVRR